MELIKVHNHQIVTAKNKPLRLRGWNIGGWLNMEDFINGFVGAEHKLRATMSRIAGREKAQFFFDRLLDHFFTEDDVKAMAKFGANVIRIPFNYRHFESDDKPFEYLENGFKRLDQAFDWCAKYGIYVILDFHAVQGWHNPDWHSDNAHVHILLYQHKHFQERFAGLWKEMAKRYKNHPALAGYGLMNEPCTRVHYENYDSPAYDRDGLNKVHRLAAQAIREVDSDHILFVEGDNFACEFDGLDVTFDENIVVESHNYMSPTGGGAVYPGVIDGMYWNRDMVAAEFGMHSGTRCAFNHHKPIFVGEFGTWYAGYPEAIKYRAAALDDQLGVFDSAGIHWAVWTWKDIASMGSFNLDPESEYVQTIAPILKAKKDAADWEGEMPKGSVAKALKNSADAIDAYLVQTNLKVQIDRRWFAQYTLFGYLAQFLQVPYANLFKDISEEKLDDMLSAFALKNCVENKTITKVLKKHLTT
ncbi:MAG TPA: cellulase family glycosylhydrolase [Anaerolineales bacterium]|mgnify:FL=1|nr:cellulase family glycosylhydrolase [Anaerolineales bacterium]